MPTRTAIKAAIAMLAGWAALSVLAGCAVDIGALQHRTNSYSLSGQLRTLVVNAHVGSVRITGSGSGQVLVTERLSFRGAAPGTTHRTAAGTATLDSSCPALETCTVGYDITVPRALTIRVGSNVGEIQLQSLSGQVTAHTNAGTITLGSVSGPVEATGHAGSVLGRDVTTNVGVGSTHVSVSRSPGSPHVITASTQTGSVTIEPAP